VPIRGYGAELGQDEVSVKASEERCRVCDADVLFLSTCPFCSTPVGETSAPTPVAVPVATTPRPAAAARAVSRGTVPEELTRAWDRSKERAKPPRRDSGRARTEASGTKRAASKPAAKASAPKRAASKPAAPRKKPAPDGTTAAPASRAPAPSTTTATPVPVLDDFAPLAPWSTTPPAAVPAERHESPQTSSDLSSWTIVPRPWRRRAALRRAQLRWVLVMVTLLAVVGGGAIMAVTMTKSAPPVWAPPAYEPGTAQLYDAGGGWTFAAEFPSAPAVERVPSSLDGKPYTATVYSAVSLSATMTVGVYPFPLGPSSLGQTMSARGFLRREVTGSGFSPANGLLRPTNSATLQGLPGLWLATSFDGGNSASFGVIVLDGHVAYEVVVTGPATTVNTSFRQVLHTFRIIDQGRAIVKF